jgi:hypothetical protein
VPDLVDDVRPAGADLVGLPQQRDLLGQRSLDATAARGCERRVVELREEPPEAQMGGEHRAPRRLRRMRRHHELEREAARCLSEVALRHVRCAESGDRLCQRLARHALLVLVLAPPAQPVVLLGEVDELEVDAERPQHERLPPRCERGDRAAQLVPLLGASRRPRPAG